MKKRTISKEEAFKRIKASNRRTEAIREGLSVPVAVRESDQGGGVYSVRVLDLPLPTSPLKELQDAE